MADAGLARHGDRCANWPTRIHRSPVDGLLQQEAFGCLFGLDTETPHVFKDFTCRSVAFDPRGRLLMGGVTDPKSRKLLNAKLWDGVSPLPPDDLGIAAFGPVGFRDDGTPIQLAVDEEKGTLTLMDLSNSGVIHHFEIPGRSRPRLG